MKLKHPESKATIEVADDSTEIYLSQGWEETGKKSVPAESDK